MGEEKNGLRSFVRGRKTIRSYSAHGKVDTDEQKTTGLAQCIAMVERARPEYSYVRRDRCIATSPHS